MVIGDGAAMLVLEEEEHARARGAQALARMVNVALASDSHHITQPMPDGLTHAMQTVLAQSGVGPGAIGYVNCHGTGTPQNDATEVVALENIFGGLDAKPVISSTKGATGHLLGSAGAIEAVITILALMQQAVPAMASTTTPEDIPFPLPTPDGPRDFAARYAMSNSLGFGGLNGSVIFEALTPQGATL